MRRLALAGLAALAGAAGPLHAQDWRTSAFSRVRGVEEVLRVDVEYGAGTLRVSPAAGELLYNGRLRYDANVFAPTIRYADGRLRVGIEGGTLRGRNLRASQLDLALGRAAPLELDLRFGAAEADLELGGLRITRAKISTGASRTVLRVSEPNPAVCRVFELEVGAARFEASGLGNLNAERLRVAGGVGEVTLDFSGEWRADMTASVEMGLGALTLRFPRDLGVRVRKSGILTGFDSQGLVRQGDVFLSQNWENASRRLTINIDAALGTIRVAWID